MNSFSFWRLMELNTMNVICDSAPTGSDNVLTSLCRPFHGLAIVSLLPWGSRPRLYASAALRGL